MALIAATCCLVALPAGVAAGDSPPTGAQLLRRLKQLDHKLAAAAKEKPTESVLIELASLEREKEQIGADLFGGQKDALYGYDLSAIYAHFSCADAQLVTAGHLEGHKEKLLAVLKHAERCLDAAAGDLRGGAFGPIGRAASDQLANVRSDLQGLITAVERGDLQHFRRDLGKVVVAKHRFIAEEVRARVRGWSFNVWYSQLAAIDRELIHAEHAGSSTENFRKHIEHAIKLKQGLEGLLADEQKQCKPAPRKTVSGSRKRRRRRASPRCTVTLTVVTTGGGSGRVGGSLACSGSCKRSFRVGTRVTLAVSPAAGSIFNGWSGPCSTLAGGCRLTLNADTRLVADVRMLGPPCQAAAFLGSQGDLKPAWRGCPRPSTGFSVSVSGYSISHVLSVLNGSGGGPYACRRARAAAANDTLLCAGSSPAGSETDVDLQTGPPPRAGAPIELRVRYDDGRIAVMRPTAGG